MKKILLWCYISSVVLIVAVLLGIRFTPWTNFISITIAIISGLIVYILSLVEDINKPLDVKGKIYKLTVTGQVYVGSTYETVEKSITATY